MTVDSTRKVIQHLEGGIVETLLVRDGDVVSAGDGLITLDPTRARSMLALISSALLKERAAEARLTAERDGSETISFPPDLTAAANLPEAQALMSSQKGIFETRRASLRGEVAILNQRVA